MTEIGVGVIGFGWMGQAHSRAYRDIPVYYGDSGIRPKLAAVAETGAEVLTAADTSCLMHSGGLMSRQKSAVRVMHLAEILAAQELAP